MVPGHVITLRGKGKTLTKENRTVPVSESGPSGLKGNLGVASIVMMVVAAAAPLTVMAANSPLIIAMGNGIAAPLDAAIATLIMYLFTAGFIVMSRYVTNAGAFYAYIQKGLGRQVGLASATLATASYTFIVLALEAYLGYTLAELLHNTLSISVPWWVMSFVVVFVAGFLGYRHIEMSSRFLGVALVLEVGVVLLADLVVLATKGTAVLDPAPFTLHAALSGSPGLGLMFAIYCFIGFESTVIFRDEARNPEVTIPRATYIAVFGVGLFYVISMWCEVAGIGLGQTVQMANEHTGDMYLIFINTYMGKVASDIVNVLLITSLFACILAFHNVVVRYQFVMARYNVLPSVISRVHDTHESPHMSSLVQTGTSLVGLIVLVVLGLDPVTQIYAWAATAGTLGYMVILSMTCLSILAFFNVRRAGKGHVWHTLVAPVGALGGLLLCLGIAIANLPTLIGGDNASVAAWGVGVLVIVSFVVGYGAAGRLKMKDPARFEALKELA